MAGSRDEKRRTTITLAAKVKRTGRPNRKADAPPVGADVQLHAEVPVLALAGLLHLGVARRGRVLGRTRRRDDGRVHDGSRAQQEPALFKQSRNRVEDALGEPVLLEQVAKAQNRTLVRHHVVAQFHPGALQLCGK